LAGIPETNDDYWVAVTREPLTILFGKCQGLGRLVGKRLFSAANFAGRKAAATFTWRIGGGAIA